MGSRAGKEKNCQIRMSSTLWTLVGEIAQELGLEDARGRHSGVIREMVAAAAAKWTHSPYVCRSDRQTVYVTREGNVFLRQVQILRLNSPRQHLPCVIEMKPEKREYYHARYGETKGVEGESEWFLSRWMLNHFAVWSGKRDASELEGFSEPPLSSAVDSVGTTYKGADLAVHAAGGRFLTREITVGLLDYVQWKDAASPLFEFDRVDIPIDIPTTNLEVSVIVDQDLFASMGVTTDEIANLALEFRNRESARFEGKEVALYPETRIEEQYGRTPADDGANEMLHQVRLLRQRVKIILESRLSNGRRVSDLSGEASDFASLRNPENFLFYRLRWPSPHLGIEACVRWEKPLRDATPSREFKRQTEGRRRVRDGGRS